MRGGAALATTVIAAACALALAFGAWLRPDGMVALLALAALCG